VGRGAKPPGLGLAGDTLVPCGEWTGAVHPVGQLARKRSVNQVIRVIPVADMASVTVLHGEAAEPVASTSERVWAIDSERHAAWGANTEEGRNARSPIVGVSYHAPVIHKAFGPALTSQAPAGDGDPRQLAWPADVAVYLCSMVRPVPRARPWASGWPAGAAGESELAP